MRNELASIGKMRAGELDLKLIQKRTENTIRDHSDTPPGVLSEIERREE